MRLADEVQIQEWVVTSIVLICAVLASLAAMFEVFRMHARQVAGNVSRRVGASAQVIES